MPVDAVVRARIDTGVKQRATVVLGRMGLTVSDAIRLMLLQVAEEQRLPFEVRVPNAASVQAMTDLEEGRGERLADAAALFKELGL